MRTTFLGIVLIMLLAGISVAAFEIQENRTFEASGNKWTVGNPPDDDFSSIQEAVYNESVTDGDILNVRWKPSWYNEYVHVNKTLTIRHHPDEFPDQYPTVLGFNVCSPGVEISEFTVRSGITLGANSSNAVIRNNNLTQSANDAIYIGPESYNNTLAQNNVSRLAVESTGDIEHFIQNISETNKIGGKPIYYWVNHRDERIPANAGHVALVNSENITVEDLFSLQSNRNGVLIVNSTDVTVANVAFKSHVEAVLARDSSQITVKDLKFQSPSYVNFSVVFSNVNDSCIQNITFDVDMVGNCAIRLLNCRNDTIKENIGFTRTQNSLEFMNIWWSDGNSIENNIIGSDNAVSGIHTLMSMYQSNNNTIIGNSFIRALGDGLFLDASVGNVIFHNSFVDNQNDARTIASADNKFDNGLEGNYWSVYNQTDSDGDGIGDTAYSIPKTQSIDYHPLMDPWSENRTYDRPIKGGPPAGSELTQKLHTLSNCTLGSTPLGFTFNRTSAQIAMNATCGGPSFLNVTIPRNWIDGNFSVSIDDFPSPFSFSYNATHSLICMLLIPGKHTVKITGLEVGNIPGDLNYDGVVDILDAIILGNYYEAEG